MVLLLCSCSRRSHVTIASKAFTESVILGEIATQLARSDGTAVEHRRELGGTRLVWDALVSGQIDAYPEYTGTIANEIFAAKRIHDDSKIRAALAEHGIEMTGPLGFSDNYALGMRQDQAQRLGIRSISDLRRHPELRLGFSNEFLDRADGWPALREAYQLPQKNVTGLVHDLAYRALADGAIDVTDLYSTDAEIPYYHLLVLEDNLHHFPEYQAVFLYRADLVRRAPQVVAALKRLEERVTRERMIAMNHEAKRQRVPESRIASEFLADTLNVSIRAAGSGIWRRLGVTTREHAGLVAPSLLAAILAGIPLGIFSASYRRLGEIVIGVLAAIYTIPGLAVLVFMLPLLGIGWKPAVAALFLYSLLPIVRNTQAGLRGISPAARESARALGLPAGARLLRVDLPLAGPSILAGIQTAAVLNIGTATLGALIGAGGYGQPILTGIRLDNYGLILEGAVPAALLALLVQGAFEMIGLLAVPRGLRLKEE